MQTECRYRDKHTQKTRRDTRKRKGQQEGKLEPQHQQGVDVAAGRQERGVSEAHLSGMTGEYHEAHSGDRPDEDVGCLTDQVVVKQQGQGSRRAQERRILDGAPRVRKEADVLDVAGLEPDPHPVRPSFPEPGE